MQQKLTLSLDAAVVEALHARVGRGNISRFIEGLIRPYLQQHALLASYQAIAADDVREKDALVWSEAS